MVYLVPIGTQPEYSGPVLHERDKCVSGHPDFPGKVGECLPIVCIDAMKRVQKQEGAIFPHHDRPECLEPIGLEVGQMSPVEPTNSLPFDKSRGEVHISVVVFIDTCDLLQMEMLRIDQAVIVQKGSEQGAIGTPILLGVMKVNPMIGTQPNCAPMILKNTPYKIVCWNIRVWNRLTGSRIHDICSNDPIGKVGPNRDVAGWLVLDEPIARAKPDVATFVFQAAKHVIVAEPIILCKIEEGFPVVTINPISGTAKPHVSGTILKAALNEKEFVRVLGIEVVLDQFRLPMIDFTGFYGTTFKTSIRLRSTG